MSGSGGGTPQTVTQTTQNNDPWGPSQPYILGALNSASSLYNSNSGNQPWTGPTQVPQHAYTNFASANMADTLWQDALNRGTSGVNAARANAEDIIKSQGITPGIKGAIGGLGQVGNQYSSIYGDASGNQNPYLMAEIEKNNRLIGDKVNSTMSGAGRYGSGAHTDLLGRSLAEAANPILLQDYENRQGRRLAATQGLGATNQAIAGLYGEGLNRTGQFSQLMPALDDARWAGARGLMDLGQLYQGRDQNELNSQINLYNAQQAYPWESLARYNAIIGGSGGLGGTKISTTQQPTASPMQRALGGGLAGAGLGSAFGPIGAGVGALGGAGLGYFL